VPEAERDWARTLAHLVGGERVAFLELARLVTGFLGRLRAYDFAAEWDDLVQEVILAAVQAARRGELRDSPAVYTYLRSAARFKFVDRLRRKRRAPMEPIEGGGGQELPWEPPEASPAEALDVREAVAKLPEKHRLAVLGVYAHGKTYDEVARETGIPLGSLKRYLRDGLASLKAALASPEGG
jgi:RNA polymerase sigma-70 factor (ECF subfamily)